MNLLPLFLFILFFFFKVSGPSMIPLNWSVCYIFLSQLFLYSICIRNVVNLMIFYQYFILQWNEWKSFMVHQGQKLFNTEITFWSEQITFIYIACKMAGCFHHLLQQQQHHQQKKITFNLTLFMVNEHIPLSIYLFLFFFLSVIFNSTSSIFVCKLKLHFTMDISVDFICEIVKCIQYPYIYVRWMLMTLPQIFGWIISFVETLTAEKTDCKNCHLELSA